MTIEITPVDAPLGAFVRGVDIATGVDAVDARLLARALREHQVLVFRDQDPDREQFLAFGDAMGGIAEPPTGRPSLGNGKRLVEVSNVTPEGVLGAGALPTHADEQADAEPPYAIMLRAVETPETGGATSWSNLYRAYDELDDRTRAKVARLRVWSGNLYSGPKAQRHFIGDNQTYDTRALPRHAHQLVRTDPRSGRKSLFVSHATRGLIGTWMPLRAKRLLKRLKLHVDQPHLYYTHGWRPGDIVIWENRTTNHKREAFDADARRVLWRAVVARALD